MNAQKLDSVQPEGSGTEIQSLDHKTVLGAPNLRDNEVVIHKARKRKLPGVIVGLIFCFVPPFVLGPLVIVLTVLSAKYDGALVTNQRIIVVRSLKLSRTRRVVEIPVGKLQLVTVRRGLFDLLAGGDGLVLIKWESESGLGAASFQGSRKLVKKINDAKNRAVERTT